MTSGSSYYLIAMEKTKPPTDTISIFPFYLLVDVFVFLISTVLSKTEKFSSNFWRFLSQLIFGKSKNLGEKQNLDLGTNHKKYSSKDKSHEGKMSREEVQMVMGKMGIFCTPQSEGLQECFSCDDFSGMFEEKEPSLEEVKQAFDIFDGNKDGFIDAKELQRMLLLLGFKEAADLERCKRMIRTFDENNDGRIDFKEFVKLMENSLC